ncbi:MAG TPA: hypothetical protein VNR68_00295 [Sphingomicrobium sp.]|nr:hypothetical protein [Sphingomicrobium sp.]
MDDAIIRRAYELAPLSRSLDEVRSKLRREGYFQIDAHFSSGTLRKELTKLLM